MNNNVLNVPYNPNDWINVRFYNHFLLGVKENIGEHNRNLIEKIGDAGLWVVEGMPRAIWKIMKEPVVVTIALTAFALLADSFLFYPSATYFALKSVVALLYIPFETLRLGTYLLTVGLIIATSLRSTGRFINTDLRNSFYNQGAAFHDHV